MKRFLPIFIIIVLLFSCNPGIPKDIIQPDKMEKVLFDIHVVDGYLTTLTNRDSTKIIASTFYKGVYKKFKIDSAVYNKSMNYYYKHPIELKNIYDKVGKNLEFEKLKFEKEFAAQSMPIDLSSARLLFLDKLPKFLINSIIGANPFDHTLALSRL